jgi:hypothetical protein
VPYDGLMAIVLVDDYPQDWLQLWRAYSTRGLKEISIPGNHYSFWVDDSEMRVLSDGVKGLLAEAASELEARS